VFILQIAVVVGGMAPQKQERLLRRGPEIVVATPGRLWELLQDGNPHLAQVSNIRCCILILFLLRLSFFVQIKTNLTGHISASCNQT